MRPISGVRGPDVILKSISTPAGEVTLMARKLLGIFGMHGVEMLREIRFLRPDIAATRFPAGEDRLLSFVSGDSSCGSTDRSWIDREMLMISAALMDMLMVMETMKMMMVTAAAAAAVVDGHSSGCQGSSGGRRCGWDGRRG